MRIDSLDELKSAFAEWRKGKKHAREPVPEELRARARRASAKHGVKAVVRVTRVECARLFRTLRPRLKAEGAASMKAKGVPGAVPAFSRLELSAPTAASLSPRPIAEVETGSGLRLRVFEQTPEMMGLLSAVCGLGGRR